MAYKVAIVTEGGNNLINSLTEREYIGLLSKKINDRLKTLGIQSILIGDDNTNLTNEDKVNLIKEKYGTGNNIIVISNRLEEKTDSGAEIMYALRNNSRLASNLATNLEDIGLTVNKYYQLRNPENTALDDDYLIRNTANNQTVAIYYGYANNNSDKQFLENNLETIAEAVVKTIANYAGINYSPVNLEGYYIVQKGDSLWSIASKNNTTVSELKTLNNLTSNALAIGQILKLPIKKDDNTVENENKYSVQKGDSLWSIANKFNTTVDNIKSLNNLSSNLLSIGQVLSIPNISYSPNQITYTVKKGDSLWSIANRYDTTIDQIKSTNNLKSNALSIGQVLIIPSTSSYVTYTVQKGDSLWIIANKFNTTVDNIKKLNILSSNLLSIGQELIIPS